MLPLETGSQGAHNAGYALLEIGPRLVLGEQNAGSGRGRVRDPVAALSDLFAVVYRSVSEICVTLHVFTTG